MTLAQFFTDNNCTAEEIKQLTAYYISLQILSMHPLMIGILMRGLQ